LCVHIDKEADLYPALVSLEINTPAPTVVLVGGAAGITDNFTSLIQDATNTIAQVVEDAKGVLLDGGTQSGIMASIGQARQQFRFSFPLIGVAVKRLVTYPGYPQEDTRYSRVDEHNPLDPNHTHFMLVPGTKWGDESPWIAKAANIFSGTRPSVTVLLNGGDISRKDINNSILANRPVITLKGTGRLADELANNAHATSIKTISAEDRYAVYHAISEILIPKGGNSWRPQIPTKAR
jgi:hypothetical protein